MAQQDNQKSAIAILRTLQEQAADCDPVDKLLQLQRDLLTMEQLYGITSKEYCRRCQIGEMGDDAEIVGWAGRYRAFIEVRNSILVA